MVISLYPHERVDDQRVVHRATAFEQNRDSFFICEPGSIGAIRRQRIEAVNDRQDSRAYRNISARQPRRIARSIPALVVVSDDRYDRIRKGDCGQDVRSDARMQLHLLELCRRQLPRLVEYVLRHCELAHIVQQRRGLDRFDLSLICHANELGQTHCVVLNASDVAVRDLIFGVDGHGQRFDRREVQTVQLRQVPTRIVNAAHRGSKRKVRYDQDGNNDPKSADV